MALVSLCVAALASLLVVRRLSELAFLHRTVRRLVLHKNLATAAEVPEARFPQVIVLLPLYKEQILVPQLLEHFAGLEYPRDRLKVVFITTEKERGSTGQTTKQVLETLLRMRSAAHFVHLHFPAAHRFRAAQLNFAVRSLLPPAPHEETYVGVYNADSLPDKDTLLILARDACLQRLATGSLPPAYQQGATYFVPGRYGKRCFAMHSAAAFQTVYTFAHYLRRLWAAERGSGEGVRRLRKGIPVTFLGHGEFIRLDVLLDVGMFPDFAYADGLLLGWLIAFAGYPIRVLPALDHCEVPRGLCALIRQHTAWFAGLLNLGAAVRECFGSGTLSQWALVEFRARRMLATVAWGVRSPCLAVLLMASILAGWPSALFATTAILFYAASPVAYAGRAYGQLSSDPPRADLPPKPALAGRMAASVPALFMDGLGFFPALWMRWKQGSAEAVPPKTER